MLLQSVARVGWVSVIILSAQGFAAESASTTLKVTFAGTTSTAALGSLSVHESTDKSVVLEGEITGLTPGKHGFHVHENGDCSDPADGFKKAGGHFNPGAALHGSLESGHAGDLGNIVANDKGVAVVKIQTKKFVITQGEKSSIHNRALVVHAGPDDEKTDPAGNSGGRILCGVLK